MTFTEVPQRHSGALMMAFSGEVSGNMESQADKQDVSLSASAFPASLTATSAKEWVTARKQHIRSWTEFFQTSRLHIPRSLAPLGKRVVKNLDYFLSNYLCIFIVLIIFCILTSPLLLIALGACGGAVYAVNRKTKGNSMKILNFELTPSHQYMAVGVASFPLLWLVGAGSAVFWILGASFFVISAHASCYQTQDEIEGFGNLQLA